MTVTNQTLSPKADLVAEKYQRLAPAQQEQVRALLASPQEIASADPRVNEMVLLARANRMTAETLTTWMHQLAQAASSSPELTEVPTWFDAASTTLVHAVPLNSSKAEFTHFEVVTLRDKAGHSLCFNVGVPRDAFTPATVVVLIEDGNPRASQPLNPSLALSLLPLLDAAVSGPTLESDRHLSAGMKVLRFVLTHTEGVAGSGKAANSFSELEAIQTAARVFDAGEYDQALQALEKVATTSTFSSVRALARLNLGECLSRCGKVKEAIEAVMVALPALDGRWRGLAQDLLARLCNKQREFPRAEQFAQDAIKDGLAMRERGQAIDLGRPYFTLGVAQKNQGKIDEAIDSMNKALAERDGKSPATSVALAGYLSIAGRHEEAHALFARIPVPPKTEREFMDYHANAAWFAGVSHDKAGVMTAAETALKAAKTFNHPGLYHYFQSEPDLDWLRGDEAFSGLLARYGH